MHTKASHKIIQDPIYGQMEIERYIVTLMDTVEFQRLRRLRQNGNALMVYPSDTHTRFEHCLGVYHLTDVILQQLQKELEQRPEWFQSPGSWEYYLEATRLVKIAALLHDVGHGPFSHLFERTLSQVDLTGIDIPDNHEKIGCLIVRHMLLEQKCSEDDIYIVQHLICGEQIDAERYPFFQKFYFLQQLVSSGISALDMDKLDYIIRDSHAVQLQVNIIVKRILQNAHLHQLAEKIVICFDSSLQFEISQVFQSRYALHKMLYQHPKVIAIDMITRRVLLLAQELGIVNFVAAIQHLKQEKSPDYFELYDELDDHVIEYIARRAREEPAAKAQEKTLELRKLVHHLKTHTIIPIVYHLCVSAAYFAEADQYSGALKKSILEAIAESGEDYSGYEIAVKEMHYGMKVANPNEYVCYTKNGCVQVTKPCLDRLQISLQSVQSEDVRVIQHQVQQISTPQAFMEFCVCIYTWDKARDHAGIIRLV